MSDNVKLRGQVQANVGCTAGVTSDETLVDKALGFVRQLRVYSKYAADAATSTTTTAWAMKLDNKVEFLSVEYMPSSGNLTAAADCANLGLLYDDGAGGAATYIASAITTSGGTGNWTAGTAVNIPLTTNNQIVDGATASKWLKFTITKTGAAVVVPAGELTAKVRLCA